MRIPEVRAHRRSARGEVDVIQKRDLLDSSRKTSPLTRVTDARLLDSGHSSVDELVAIALQHLASRGLKIAAA